MITYIIIAITCVVSLVGFTNRNFFAKYVYHPYTVNRNKKEWYRVFTHAFLHADYAHLFFNMFSLWALGLPLEVNIFPAIFGGKAEYYYALIYFGGIMAASFPAFEKQKNNFGYTAVGASGAVCAVIFSFILIAPDVKLSMFFIPIGIPAAIYGAAFLLISWYLSRRGGGHIAHDAHLWGSIFGFVFTILLKFSLLPAFIEQVKAIF